MLANAYKRETKIGAYSLYCIKQSVTNFCSTFSLYKSARGFKVKTGFMATC